MLLRANKYIVLTFYSFFQVPFPFPSQACPVADLDDPDLALYLCIDDMQVT